MRRGECEHGRDQNAGTERQPASRAQAPPQILGFAFEIAWSATLHSGGPVSQNTGAPDTEVVPEMSFSRLLPRLKGLLLVSGLLLGTGACVLITDIDRSQIPPDEADIGGDDDGDDDDPSEGGAGGEPSTDSGAGGSGGSGGSVVDGGSAGNGGAAGSADSGVAGNDSGGAADSGVAGDGSGDGGIGDDGGLGGNDAGSAGSAGMDASVAGDAG